MKVVLEVEHKGKSKMVAKLFEVGPMLIALHEAASNQYHKNTDSPGGVDAGVVEYLEASKVDFYHHYDRGTNTLYAVPIKLLRQFGIWQNSDGRVRCYLPLRFWTRHEGLPYEVPWITDKKLVPKSEMKPTPAPKPIKTKAPAKFKEDSLTLWD